MDVVSQPTVDVRMADRLRQLERYAEGSPGGAEVAQMKAIAIAAAADMREALAWFTSRGDIAAAGEAYLAMVKAAVAELLMHFGEEGELPGPDDITWESFPRLDTAGLSPVVAAAVEEMRDTVVRSLAGAHFGETRTDTRWKVTLEGLTAQALFAAKQAQHRRQSAAEAIKAFDRISSIMQSMMKSDTTASRWDGSSLPG